MNNKQKLAKVERALDGVKEDRRAEKFRYTLATKEDFEQDDTCGEASIWYSDGDMMGKIYSNMGIGIYAEDVAKEIVRSLNRSKRIKRES